jgi:uncharacterized protein YcbX
MINSLAVLKFLFRYPVKGLSPQSLTQTILSPGQTVPGDRIYAIENGPCGFDPATPSYFPKQRFLMLMRNEQLAVLRTSYDEANHTLVIENGGQIAARGDLRTEQGRAVIEAFFASYCEKDLRGPPKVLFAEGHSFSDVSHKVISIINLASVASVEEAVGHPVDPLRFRGNLYVEGWPAWSEFNLLGQELTIGGARLKLFKRIKRCAATDVDPTSGARDLAIPRTLTQSFGHADCGVYAEVVQGGSVSVGDFIKTN